MSLGLIAVLLAGGSFAVSVAILIVVLRVLHTARSETQSGRERLAILREQQERLAFMQEERRLFLEELERRRSAMEELERQRELERAEPTPAPAAPQTGKQRRERSWWRRVFGE